MKAVLRVAGILAFGLSALLLYNLLCVAQADWLSKERTRDSILAAISIFPENSLFYRFWAEIEPADAVVALRQAAFVNPMNPGIRFELGMAAEKAGNLAEAEASLLKALQFDHTGIPSGTLAQFYFRHHQAEKYWPMARDALSHSYDNSTALFEDCWALSSDPDFILSKAIPDRPKALIAYLNFLLQRSRLDAAVAVSDRIMAQPASDNAAKSLLNYCDRLIENNSPHQAVRVWNWLCQSKFVPYTALDPDAGGSLTNGGFTLSPLSRGFDWRPSPNGGLYVEHPKNAAALNLTFTGDQPENCELLSQFVLLQPKRKYRLQVRYSTSDIAKESGLIWRILSMPRNQDLLGNAGALPGGEQQEISVPFEGPADATIARLVLSYERVKGTVRIEGSAQLQHVDLIAEQQ